MWHKWVKVFAALCCAIIVFNSQELQAVAEPVLACESLQKCLDYVKVDDCLGDDETCDLGFIDISKGYFSLPAQFEKFGRSAIPPLLELVATSHKSAQAKAGYLLSENRNLQAGDLPVIFKSWDTGNGWAREALAKLANEEVAGKVLSALRNRPERGGVPRIVDEQAIREDREDSLVTALFRDRPELLLPRLLCWNSKACDPLLFERLSSLLIEASKGQDGLKPQFSEVFRAILLLPLDRAPERPYVLSALRSAHLLGSVTEQIKDQVALYSKHSDSKVRATAVDALMHWKDRRSLQHQLTYLKMHSGYKRLKTLRQLAKLGVEAREAGEEIAEYLNDEDWDVRAEAAAVLGLIGATDEVPKLATATTDADWLLTFRIVEALSKLDLEDKSGKRRELADSYWHPAVRDLAARSLLEGIDTSRSADFFPPPQDAYCVAQMKEPRTSMARKLPGRELPVPSFDGGELMTNQKVIERITIRGEDFGEFSGSLVVSSGASSTSIFDGNVNAVFKTSRGLYAISSMAHMLSDYGYLLEVRNVNGKWTARKTLRLQSAVYQPFQLGDMALLKGSGGSIWMDENMKPHWIACDPHPRDWSDWLK